MDKFLLILIAVILQSCSSEDGATKTELEGTWVQCIPSLQTIDVGGTTVSIISGPSNKVTTTYQGNSASTLIETHSDADCVTLISTTGPTEEPFKIGNQFTSINGVLVTEIDFSTNNKTIYLLQDAGNTLYFGKQCDALNAQCVNNRPQEIDYAHPATKVN